MTATHRPTLSLDQLGPGEPLPGPSPARPWYRRKSFLVPAVSAVIVAAIVVSDLPQPNSRAAEISNSASVVSQVNENVGPCSFALSESFTIYDDLVSGSLTPSEQGQVPRLLNDDQSACSFTDNSIYNLSTMDVPGGTYGNDLGQIVTVVTLWATSDALAAIEEIQVLDATPADLKARRSLAQEVRALGHDRAQAVAELQAVDTLLHTHLAALHLAQTPVLPSPR
ncbi:MAG TPA: hypothetical protein VMS00_09840 [Acidimicrobiales bacterium]|nr:hypothetical protein [Acidimicrobiales bacterium]